jgi:hypothetical protein
MTQMSVDMRTIRRGGGGTIDGGTPIGEKVRRAERPQSMKNRIKLASIATLAAAFLVAAVPAYAGKPGGGGGGGGGGQTGGGGGSLTLVPLYTHSGGPVVGDWITFSVSTSATYQYVRVTCTQGGTLVYSVTNGFFPAYPWGQNFQLSWASGSASCVGTLFVTNSKGGSTTLATTSFTVSG